MFVSAERRARTYLVRRGVIDQTSRDLTSLLRECVPAQDARELSAKGVYRWYVWPGFNARTRGEYGHLLVTATFTAR
jgi:hypothetical protein